MNDLVSPVSIDPRLDSGSRTLVSSLSHDDLGSASAAFIPADFLSTPVTSTYRFKKLVDNYGLDLAPNGSIPSFTNKPVKKSGGVITAGKARLVVEPKWMLWSNSVDCA